MMGNKRNIMNQLLATPAFAPQSLPNQPIIEVVGTKRVLVENHCGVKEYGQSRITIQVRYGCVCVTGCHLEVIRMTKEQLVISGTIQGIQLLGREGV